MGGGRTAAMRNAASCTYAYAQDTCMYTDACACVYAYTKDTCMYTDAYAWHGPMY